jgi:phage gp16-like protein
MAGDRPDALKRVIKAIQACRRQVTGLEEDATWRTYLERVTKGQTSLRAMGGRDLGKVLDALHASGAPRPGGGARRSRYADDPQTRMMRGLWIELHEAGKVTDPSEEALSAFVRRQTRQDMGALSAASARSVIEALKAMLNRPAPTKRSAA